MHEPEPRPTRADLAAAAGASIGEVIAPDLRVLFCGINPGLWSGATGHHFGRPGNRFWPALAGAGFTPRLLRPAEQQELTAYGVGIVNLVDRATARADELERAELRAGAQRLTGLVEQWRPRCVAVVGVTAYRQAFDHPSARIGRQDELIAGRPVWVLPNPSGLNAHYNQQAITAEFAALRSWLTPAPG
jgi:double-stranded uracil-DNA glycosylase